MAGVARRGVKARQLSVMIEQHARVLSACRRCTFADPAVLPVVSMCREPLAMLIGPAPGKTEVVDRRPFAGRAGKTLFRWFAEVGIDEAVARRRIYIAAVTRCFPGSSPTGRGDRLPSPHQIANCAGWLEAEIEMISPKVVIAVGRLAIERFLGTAPLSQLVGRAHRLDDRRGRPIVIPLPHPSGASSWIHVPGHMDLVRSALTLVAEHVPQLVRESRQVRVA